MLHPSAAGWDRDGAFSGVWKWCGVHWATHLGAVCVLLASHGEPNTESPKELWGQSRVGETVGVCNPELWGQAGSCVCKCPWSVIVCRSWLSAPRAVCGSLWLTNSPQSGCQDLPNSRLAQYFSAWQSCIPEIHIPPHFLAEGAPSEECSHLCSFPQSVSSPSPLQT